MLRWKAWQEEQKHFRTGLGDSIQDTMCSEYASYLTTPGLCNGSTKPNQHFQNTIHNILNNNPLLTWVPGHSNIIGNDASDRLAKHSAADTPASPGFILAAFSANTYKCLLWEAWQHEWQDHPASNNVTDYTIANTIPPPWDQPKSFAS